MSNSSIVERLNALADGYEAGQVSIRVLATQLVGHAEALEGMQYRQIKEAQLVQVQLAQAIEAGQESNVDQQALAGWLRMWIASIPLATA